MSLSLRSLWTWLCLAVLAHGAIPTRPLPDVLIPTPSGKKINLRQYRGKVLLVALVSTSCQECLETVNILNRVQKELGPKGFQAVAIAFEPGAASLIGPFIARYRPIYPFGSLEKDPAFKLAGLPDSARPFVPILMFVDGKGLVRLQVQGDSPVMKSEESTIRAVVNNYLAEAARAAAPKKTTETAPAAPPVSDKPAPSDKPAAPAPSTPVSPQ